MNQVKKTLIKIAYENEGIEDRLLSVIENFDGQNKVAAEGVEKLLSNLEDGAQSLKEDVADMSGTIGMLEAVTLDHDYLDSEDNASLAGLAADMKAMIDQADKVQTKAKQMQDRLDRAQEMAKKQEEAEKELKKEQGE